MKARIKKLGLAVLLAGGLVVGLGSTAFAGGPGHNKHEFGGEKMFQKLDGMSEQERLEFFEDKLDQRVTKMTKHLDLDKSQQSKVRQIMGDAQTQLLEIYEQNKAAKDKANARGEAQAVFKQARQDVGDILTDDQKAKAKAHRKQRHQKGKAKMIERLDQKLDLSDVQRVKIEKIMDATHKEVKALREKGGDREATRAEAKELRESAADKITEVLSETQKAKFAQMRERRAERSNQGPKGPRGKKAKRGAF